MVYKRKIKTRHGLTTRITETSTWINHHNLPFLRDFETQPDAFTRENLPIEVKPAHFRTPHSFGSLSRELLDNRSSACKLKFFHCFLP
jgi:hypothetical protein